MARSYTVHQQPLLASFMETATVDEQTGDRREYSQAVDPNQEFGKHLEGGEHAEDRARYRDRHGSYGRGSNWYASPGRGGRYDYHDRSSGYDHWSYDRRDNGGKGSKGGKGGKGGPDRPVQLLPDSVEIPIEAKFFENFKHQQIPEKYRKPAGGKGSISVKIAFERACKDVTGKREVCRDSGCCYTTDCPNQTKSGWCEFRGIKLEHIKITAQQRYEAAQKAGLSTILVPKSN